MKKARMHLNTGLEQPQNVLFAGLESSLTELDALPTWSVEKATDFLSTVAESPASARHASCPDCGSGPIGSISKPNVAVAVGETITAKVSWCRNGHEFVVAKYYHQIDCLQPSSKRSPESNEEEELPYVPVMVPSVKIKQENRPAAAFLSSKIYSKTMLGLCRGYGRFSKGAVLKELPLTVFTPRKGEEDTYDHIGGSIVAPLYEDETINTCFYIKEIGQFKRAYAMVNGVCIGFIDTDGGYAAFYTNVLNLRKELTSRDKFVVWAHSLAEKKDTELIDKPPFFVGDFVYYHSRSK